MATSTAARLRPDCRGVAVERRPHRRQRWKGRPRQRLVWRQTKIQKQTKACRSRSSKASLSSGM
eukprot:5882034-Lingulodinium_polyedra.AAC.1